MSAPRRSVVTLCCGLAAAGLLLASCEDAGARKKKKKEAPTAEAAPEPGGGDCKAPAPSDPRLAEGLDRYLEGDWPGAIGPLQAWSGSDEAAADPAAGRGYYSLGYAFTATRRPQLSEAWYAKAEPLLRASAESAPSLEDLYYLASLYRTQREAGKQLDVVSRALGLLEAGQLCPVPDGDDDFRIARLLSFAGREEERAARLEQAVAKYEKGQGRVVAYHALALQELGEAAREAGDLAAWEERLSKAAELDPSIPKVHRSLGLAMLKRGRVKEAAEYWRRHWRLERDRGNDLVYAVRVLQTELEFQERFGEEHRIENIAEYTKEALEQNASYEAKRMATAAAALDAGGLTAEDEEAQRLAHDVANYRMVQFLREYVAREHDLAEFALQNGLLPAIHGAGLPRR